MLALRKFQTHCLKTLSFLQSRSSFVRDVSLPMQFSNEVMSKPSRNIYSPSTSVFSSVNGSRFMSTYKGRTMRSKVEKRMQRETGKTLREMRRAKKLRKKLMTDEERLIYNLRRAKKKVALLLQKLKKYELPELPAPRHDPELLTVEQLQAYKKIGFRNRNYVPVGVRGVFGGVVQNMHLHWKFHETVQVCCDNFPKEKIKEMATMLARLSGGIVVNVHNVKTIIMFRGRNYRQPKNLIPINTLTKRKALFKARFEQALESQKLNIKKIEQQLRRKGVNPEDPVAMASIQRVASTFFRAIDEQQGTPYVFRGDRQPMPEADATQEEQPDLPSEDSDQEELDRFIAEIEDAADQEWAAEEAAEKEESARLRYWDKDGMGMRRRSSNWSDDELENEDRNHGRYQKNLGNKQRTMDIRKWNSENEISEASEDHECDSENEMRDNRSDFGSDMDSADEAPQRRESSRLKGNRIGHKEAYRARGSARFREKTREVDDGSDNDVLGEDRLWESDDGKEHGLATSGRAAFDYLSSDDEDDDNNRESNDRKGEIKKKKIDESWDSD
ncbi:CRM-domain containing factor CFM9, mitochondrial [Typha latifolia]|uniref:CRM-domain containing factor CFM9, mitochondrial n=1 Tax=Typha latifolia TaxID=4733 RepID=UPI003C2C63E1